MSKKEAVAHGVRALNAHHQSRWEMGDALLEFGWKPSKDGVKSGGLDVVADFSREVADGAGVDIDTMPDQITLIHYGIAANAVRTKILRKHVAVNTAYEAIRAVGDEATDLLQRLLKEHGKATVDLVRLETGGTPTRQPKREKSPLEELTEATMHAWLAQEKLLEGQQELDDQERVLMISLGEKLQRLGKIIVQQVESGSRAINLDQFYADLDEFKAAQS